jgi:hypothetical protein
MIRAYVGLMVMVAVALPVLSACMITEGVPSKPVLKLKQVGFSDVAGWQSDNQAESLSTRG